MSVDPPCETEGRWVDRVSILMATRSPESHVYHHRTLHGEEFRRGRNEVGVSSGRSEETVSILIFESLCF